MSTTPLARLNALSDPRARAARAHRYLTETPPSRAVAELHAEIVRARRAAAPGALAALAVAITTGSGLGYQSTAALYWASHIARPARAY